MSLPRTPMPPFPGTPQNRGSLVNQLNQPYQSSGQYSFTGQAAPVPSHMSQFGYAIGSPARPGSGFEQAELEDDYNNVDGEYYDPEEHGQFFVPDSSLVQDWPFGHKSGLEGKSTITYAPQMPQPRGIGQTDPGMFASALRGQSIQYGSYGQQQPAPPARPAMPGPGFFAQTQQPCQPVTVQGPSQQLGMMGLPGQPTAMSPRPTQAAVSKPPVTSIMPPNAVASPSMTAKPRLIPESVGVPSPKPGEKPAAQSTTLSQQQATQGIFTKPTSQIQVPATQSPATSSSVLASLLTDPKTASPSVSYSPGSASSALSTLAARHQQETSQSETSIPASTAAQNTPQKTIFSGFVFTSTPKITGPKAEEKPKEPVTTASDLKPFSGFSFTLPPKTTAVTSVSKTEPTPVSKQAVATTTTSPFVMGQNTISSTFGSVAAAGGSANAFQASGDFKGFQGAGQAVFGKTPSPKKGDKSLDDEHVDEYEPEVDFKPIVPLPALVSVKTGEEDEEKLFSERTKLFRFDTDAQQWKERGIGELKILKHKVTNKVRILMRREQVLKVCANHTIKPDMKLSPMSSSDKAWCWTAMDYADGEMKHEKLAARFKSAEVAAKFKEVFEQCQTDISASEGQTIVAASKPKEEIKSEKGDLSALFKQKVGSWNCDGCLITNTAEILKCPCCGTLKPGVKAEDVKEEPASSVFAKVGAPSSSSGFKFGGTSSATSSSQPGSGFVFGGQTSSGTSAGTQSSGFKFDIQSSSAISSTTGNQPTEGGFKIVTQAAADSTSVKTAGFKFVVQPSEETESKEGLTSKFGNKPADSSGVAASAGFAFDKDSTKYSFESDSKSDAKESDVDKTDASKTCQTKPNLLAHLLDSESDMWKCDKCLVNNDEKELKCVCCSEPKPGSEVLTSQGPAASTLAKFGSGFNINQPTGSSFSFGSSQVSGASKEASSASSGFTFGDSTKKTDGFTFGTPAKVEGFKFDPVAAKEKSSSVTSEGFNFSMSMTPTMPHSGRSPLKSPGVTSPKSPAANDDGYYITHEGDDSHIYFEPVIPLPEKVEVKTGEEDEEVIFSHRAKLFRFVNGEWKERGLGDIKVLFNKNEGKARILMRREQIFKICCNHYVSKELNLKIMPNSKDRALVWYAIDFADGEQKAENFSIRFKTAEVATDFQAAVDDAKARLFGGKSETVKETTDTQTDSTTEVETVGAVLTDDVIFLKEETASPEEIQKAREYLLPDNFYMYLRKLPCPGCIGCDSDSFSMDQKVKQEPVDQYSEDYEDEEDEDELDEEDEVDDDDDYETEEEYEDESGMLF